MDEHREYLTEYIRSLPEEALDRIVEAQNWCANAFWHRSSRCLVGHVENWGPDRISNAVLEKVRLDGFPDAYRHFDWWCDPTRNYVGPIPLEHEAVQFVKQVAAQEIAKRANAAAVTATQTPALA